MKVFRKIYNIYTASKKLFCNIWEKGFCQWIDIESKIENFWNGKILHHFFIWRTGHWNVEIRVYFPLIDIMPVRPVLRRTLYTDNAAVRQLEVYRIPTSKKHLSLWYKHPTLRMDHAFDSLSKIRSADSYWRAHQHSKGETTPSSPTCLLIVR